MKTLALILLTIAGLGAARGQSTSPRLFGEWSIGLFQPLGSFTSTLTPEIALRAAGGVEFGDLAVGASAGIVHANDTQFGNRVETQSYETRIVTVEAEAAVRLWSSGIARASAGIRGGMLLAKSWTTPVEIYQAPLAPPFPDAARLAIEPFVRFGLDHLWLEPSMLISNGGVVAMQIGVTVGSL